MTRSGALKYFPATQAWLIECPPEMAMRLKRIFPRCSQEGGTKLRVKHTPEVANDLEWIRLRFPLAADAGDESFLATAAEAHRARLARIEAIIASPPLPGAFEMVIPPRDYQSLAASLYIEQNFLLLGDQVGLGKTISAIASLTDVRTLPVAVVVKAHLPRQWADEIARFLPLLRVHIVKQRAAYEMPDADVYLVTYSKLDACWGTLAERVKSVIYDEIQELRIQGSAKYKAAECLSSIARYRLGLSATPIYNYGGEIWSVMNLLCPDILGSQDEFQREWCVAAGNGHWAVREPDTLGAYLRNNSMMLRRTRRQVGRELPPVMRHVQDANFDRAVYEQGLTAADELARILLSGTFVERGQAAREFDLKLRQATGLAKAPFVAELVRMLVDSGEKVLLGGWHRAVYAVWLERLRAAGIRVVMFTGSESATQKEAARRDFIEGRADVMVMSLRSGSGTNGLQNVCSTCVLGEFDWSPAVHEQFIGRLNRDGQEESVQVFIPVAPVGSDPTMACILGIKDAQATGVVDLGADVDVEFTETDPQRLKQLAIDYLKSRKLSIPATQAEEAA